MITEVGRNTVLLFWWKRETWQYSFQHLWGCRVTGEKGRQISFSTLLCLSPPQVQMHTFLNFFDYVCSLLHRQYNWAADPLEASRGTSPTMETTCSSAGFSCGCVYSYWYVFPQSKTAAKATAYSSGNIASEGRERNHNFSQKWLISPNLQFSRNVFTSKSCQLKQSTFLPAGYANAKIDPLCIKTLKYLDVTERKELY